jgi:succinate dehydrogenase / fumarate reductase iron-sulfur subunit
MDAIDTTQPVTVRPMRSFPILKDLVTDVSWNYKVNKKIPPFTPKPNTDWKMEQEDVDRV